MFIIAIVTILLLTRKIPVLQYALMSNSMDSIASKISHPEPEITLIDLDGEFAGIGAISKEQEILGSVDEMTSGRVDLDVKDLSFIDSTGIGVFFKLYSKIRDRKIELKILEPNSFVMKTLIIAKVDRIAKFVTTP